MMETPTLAGLKVMLVEGHDDIWETLYSRLLNDGCILFSVNTAKDALRLMKLDNFDLVLCNFQLPDAVGPDCCRQMAAINPHTYRIVIAAPGDRYQNAKRLSPSAAEVIETPFRVASLVKAIAATLAGKRQVEKRTWKNLLRPAVSPC